MWPCLPETPLFKVMLCFGSVPWMQVSGSSWQAMEVYTSPIDLHIATAADLLALKDDFLGAVALNVRDIAAMKQGETEKVVQVDDNLLRGGKFSGRIKFQIDVEVSYRRGMFTPLRLDESVL